MDYIVRRAKELKEKYLESSTNTQLANLCDKYADLSDTIAEKLEGCEKGFINVKSVKHNGKTKAVVTTSDGAACVIFDRGTKKVLLVKQQRVAVNCDSTWEIPAGVIDDEFPIDAASREVKEETGVDISIADLKFMLKYYPSIGYSSQEVTIYLGIVDINDADGAVDDNEVSEKKWVTVEELKKMVYKGEIIDGKTIIALGILRENYPHLLVY